MDSQTEGSRSHIDSFHKVTLEDNDRDDPGHEHDTVENVDNVNDYNFDDEYDDDDYYVVYIKKESVHNQASDTMDSQTEGSRSHIDSFHKVTLEDNDRDDPGHEHDTVENVDNIDDDNFDDDANNDDDDNDDYDAFYIKRDRFFLLDKTIEKSGEDDGDIKRKWRDGEDIMMSELPTETRNYFIESMFSLPPVVGYLKGITHTSFDVWLRDNPPSREVNCLEWIAVYHNYDDTDIDSELELLDSWKSLKTTGRPITKRCIFDLAVKHKVLSGKWVFWADSGGKMDHLWSVVARGIIEGDLGKVCNTSKVSAYRPGMYPNHVVCIYNKDCSDRADILKLEAAIRNTGLLCELVYKPDIFTHLGIYSGNKYGLCPVVMKSQFDVKKRMSIITDI